MKTTTIKQTATFYAIPEQIYHLIMDQKKHSAFTGLKATISTKINGKFSVFDGYCHGYNIELEEGEKIVQAWHFAEDGWPDDHFSICTFALTPAGNKTKLSFVQTNVPEQHAPSLSEGWKQFYWNAIKKYLKEH
jgi:activator of HSP90 ATPase